MGKFKFFIALVFPKIKILKTIILTRQMTSILNTLITYTLKIDVRLDYEVWPNILLMQNIFVKSLQCRYVR